MKIDKFDIKGPILVKNKIFHDHRGFFYEKANLKKKEKVFEGLSDIVQENISISKKYVLRGLHLQLYPKSQSKLISVIKGEILDIFVDCRKNSRTFGKYKKIKLKENDGKTLFIPKDFAHGFLSLKPNTIVSYLVDNFYSKKHERTILWNDKDINVKWPKISKDFIISDKDKKGINLSQL